VCVHTRKKAQRLERERRVLVGWAQIRSSVAEKAGGRDRLRENDTDGNEDGACAGSVRNCDFEASAFWILITATKADAAFRQILTDSNFFLKAPAADAGQDAGLDAGSVAARYDTFFDGAARGKCLLDGGFRLRFNPNGRGIAVAADTRGTFANFEGFQLHLVQVDDFAPLAEAAFHEQPGEGFLGFVWSGKIDVPEIGARIEDGDGVDEPFRLTIDFRDNPGSYGFALIAFQFAMQSKFLAGKQLFLEAEHAAVTADQKSLGTLADFCARGIRP
jgi:hypothetical protein